MAGKDREHSGSMGGVSLASFLQILEQERKSCTLTVAVDDDEGHFYFADGVLVDAAYAGQVGEEAAYTLLALDQPSFRVTGAEERIHRIRVPLAHLLLNAATRKDEGSGHGAGNMTNGSASPHESPGVQRLVEAIASIAGVHHYYLLNRQGKVIAQSSKNRKMGDFITYCIVSGIQIRKALDAKGPHRIHIDLDNGEILLVIPGAGMIIGLLLDENVSIADVTAVLRSAMAK